MAGAAAHDDDETGTAGGGDDRRANNSDNNAGGNGGLVRGPAGGGNAAVTLRTGGTIAGIIPTSIEEVFRLAKAIAASGLAPRDMSTPEKLTVAILHGLEVGIPPMMAVNKIAVVNGRPTLWGDAIPALLLSRGFKLREEIGNGPGGRFAEATVIRPGGESITRTFTEADAKVAGLWQKAGPWKQYPDRMLQMRARGLAARDGAADVLGGMYVAEEAMDVPEPRVATGELLDVAPASNQRKSSSQAKKDGDDVAFNEVRGAISSADSIEALDAIAEANAELLNTLPNGWARLIASEMADKREELTNG